jgi:uncharacterized damage-inducible protein DinB
MTVEQILALYKRDLEKLKNEIAFYNNENSLWIIDKNISNSAGNLCLHLIGNLNHFIGHIIGKTNYIRNRNDEFNLEDISRQDLIQSIIETTQIIEGSLHLMTNEQLTDDYPILKFEETKSNEFLLMHLLFHLNYHLGQINYHRRVFDI